MFSPTPEHFNMHDAKTHLSRIIDVRRNVLPTGPCSGTASSQLVPLQDRLRRLERALPVGDVQIEPGPLAHDAVHPAGRVVAVLYPSDRSVRPGPELAVLA
jgi:hypothetical protein